MLHISAVAEICNILNASIKRWSMLILWKNFSSLPLLPLPSLPSSAGLYVKENAFLSCSVLSISETVMTLTKDSAPYTSTSARISGSHGYGKIKTLFCNLLKPIAFRWSLIISRKVFFFSGTSNVTTLHFPSHFFLRAMRKARSEISYRLAASFPFSVRESVIVPSGNCFSSNNFSPHRPWSERLKLLWSMCFHPLCIAFNVRKYCFGEPERPRTTPPRKRRRIFFCKELFRRIVINVTYFRGRGNMLHSEFNNQLQHLY